MNKNDEKFKAGMVTLVGRSNVGKSTLMNALIGFRIAPVSPKPQTTRWPVRGIHEDERGQMVCVDTPGLFGQIPDKLTRIVNRNLMENLKGIDVLVYVVDPTREIGQEEKRLLSLVREIKNKILVINKIDLSKPKYLEAYKSLDEGFVDKINISAKQGKHIKSLINLIYDYLPEGEPIYSDEDKMFLDQPMDIWLAEMIREKVFHHLHQELPYSVHVEVESMENKVNQLKIEALVITSNERYKPMIIGKGARKLMEIAENVKKELGALLQKKIILKLRVKVDKNWVERL